MSVYTKSIIEDLLERPFSSRSFSEKRLIVQNGRPCPRLTGLKSVHKDSKKEYNRYFNSNQYTLYPWLAGCENKMKLYCWPCLLFSRIDSAWNTTGLENLNTLQILQKKHKQSIPHMQCVLKLASFGENGDETLSAQIRTLNSQHNQQVKRNREILKRLIDVTCFLANQELPFTGHDQSLTSLNQGNYVEILNLLKRYDPTLAAHFQTNNVFNCTSKEIQDDLIRAVGELINSNIFKQLELSEFVAIMLDESSDTQMESQLSVVFRYCLRGRVYESFVGFIDASSGRSAEDIFEIVKTLLIKYDIIHKLVAQTYDGAVAWPGHVNVLQAKVRELCPCALFVHCYSHVLNVVLSQGLSNIKECRIFFITLNGVSNFAAHSSKKTCSLKEYLKRKIPFLAETRWCFTSQLVNVVNTYRDLIIEYFDSIQNDESVWNSKDRMAASGYSKFLKTFETIFLLNVFSKVFADSDVLFNILQDENTVIANVVHHINKYEIFLKNQREEGFSQAWQCTSQIIQTQAQTSRDKARIEKFYSKETKYEAIFYEIVDSLMMQISERFLSFDRLEYFDLLNGKNFNDFTQKGQFPEKILGDLIQSYPEVFDFNQLKSELTVFYASSEEIRPQVRTELTENAISDVTIKKSITPYDVLYYIENKSIAASFEQVYKLSKLICAIPATTFSEHSFSALKRIQTYLQSTVGQERLSVLALLSIEKEMLAELRNSGDFYDRVIETFLSFERRVDFLFK